MMDYIIFEWGEFCLIVRLGMFFFVFFSSLKSKSIKTALYCESDQVKMLKKKAWYCAQLFTRLLLQFPCWEKRGSVSPLGQDVSWSSRHAALMCCLFLQLGVSVYHVRLIMWPTYIAASLYFLNYSIVSPLACLGIFVNLAGVLFKHNKSRT